MEQKFQPTLFQEDSPANLSPLQEKEREQKIIATSGLKCLELLPKSNQDGLLAKMCKALLTSTTAWYSDRCKLIWKHKVSKSNVSLFQLQASVLGTKGTESGFLATPNTMDHLPPRSKEGILKQQQGHRKGRKRPGNLREQVDPFTMSMYPTPTSQDHSRNTVPPSIGETRGMDLSMRVVADQIKMYPTPTVDCEEGGEQSKRVEQTKSGGFILRKKNKPNSTFGAKLSDAMLYLNRPKVGGKLNPHFLEFLMGYPMNWTKIEPIELNHLEIQSSHKSPLKSEKQSSMPKMMFRTPTAMDIGEDSFVYAAKILKGKVNRSSNERVQITLSTDVAMEYLKENPHLINQYDKPFMVRPKLPKKEDFIKYIRDNTSIKILTNNTDIPKTKIEHWFRKDNCFSYPTVKDWNKIKPFLKNIKFDEEMTYEKEEDWIQNN